MHGNSDWGGANNVFDVGYFGIGNIIYEEFMR